MSRLKLIELSEAHLPFGGSSVKRTVGCPAWRNISEPVLHINRTSPAAERGTMLHDLLERHAIAVWDEYRALTPDTPPPVGHLSEPDAAAALNAWEQLCVIAALPELVAPEFYFEIQGTMQGYEDTVGGTADVFVLDLEAKLAVIADYKFGAVKVGKDAVGQLMFYLNALRDTYPTALDQITHYRAYIIQPEISRELIPHEIDIGKLDQFYDEVLDAVDLAEDKAIPPSAGAHCAWCPGAGLCPEKLKAPVLPPALEKIMKR